jgi:thymidylate kinase
MLIEFFAIPGAGKTTLVKAVAEKASVRTRHQISDKWNRQPLLQRGANLARSYLKLDRVADVLRFAAATRIANTDSLRRLLRLVGKTDRLHSESGTILLDQGSLQELWSILYANGSLATDPRILARLIGSLYDGLDASILFIDLDAKTASKRISARSHGHSRLDGLSNEQIRDDLARAENLPRQIIEAAALAGLNVTILDGSAPVDELLSATLAAVLEGPAATSRRSGPYSGRSKTGLQ